MDGDVRVGVERRRENQREHYATVQDAIDAAATGGTVTLLTDVSIRAPLEIPADKAVTLDLDGHGIRGNNTKHVVTIGIGAALTLVDGNTDELTHNYTVDETGIAAVDDKATGDGAESFAGGYITGSADSGAYVKGDGTANNVFLVVYESEDEDGYEIVPIIVAGELGDVLAYAGAFTDGLSGKGSEDNFTSDINGYAVRLTDDKGEAWSG